MKYSKENLKVGQKVKLITESQLNFKPYGGINDDMRKLLGKEVTVAGVYKDAFEIREDNETWVWDYKLISKKDNKPSSKKYNGYEFEDEDCILPCGYALLNVIENDRAVICFVGEEYSGNIIKTVARCHEDDEFDLIKGIEICMYKTLRKIADKHLRRY